MIDLNKFSFAFITKCVCAFGILPILVLFPASVVRAQAPNDNGAPLGLAPGSPEGAYALSGFENVNLYNGGLSFSIPVQQIGGRGKAGYAAHVPIESKWMVTKNEWYDENNNMWVKWYIPSVAEYYGENYGPGSLTVRYSTWKPEGCYIGWDYYTTFRWATTSIIFKAPDGTEHELVDQATMGQPTNYPSCSLNGNNRGPIFVSRDQPGMTFISDIQVRDAPYWGSGRIKGYLKMPDGTVYRFDEIEHCYQWGCWYETRLSWMRDANGNKTTFTYSEIPFYGQRITSIKDSLNREVTIEYNVTQAPYGTHDRLTYKGFGGANRVVRVQRDSLSNALRSGFTIQTLKQLFPTLDGAEDPYNPSVTTAIWLPDSDGVTRRYRFFYNSYGELARVELPTGGAIEYDWGPGLANGANGGLINPVPNAAHWMDLDEEMPQVYRRLLARRAYDTGNVLLGSTTYSRPEAQNGDNSINNIGYVGVSHLAANGQQLAAEVHYFYGSPATSFFTWQASPEYLPTYSPFAAYRDGHEYQTDFYAANGSTLLRRTNQSWDQQPLGWWSGSAETCPANNPFVKETLTTLGDSGQVTKTTNINPQTGQIMIDQFGNPLDVWIYDYGQGQPGALLRRMHTEFLTVNPVNGVDYTNRTSPTGPHRFSLPTRTSVYDANDVERARTTFEYDNYGTDAGHAALVDRPSISGFDPSFSIYYSTRGNPTATTRYFLTNGSVTGSITGYVQYDIAGNTVKAIDARGNATNFDFTDRFGGPDGEAQANSGAAELNSVGQYSYGFATQVTNALNHTVFTQFDYYLGKPVDEQDANGTVYSGYYNDALDRPTQMISGANRDVTLRRQTLFSYNEVGRVVTTTSDFNSFNEANPLKSQSFYDGMGRTTETRQFESVNTYIAVQQRYDSLGRVFQVSNPFRNGETQVWSTTTFDELSRVLSVTTPDNAATSNSYSGNTATTSDQTSKKRKSVTDALGRLTAVYEDPLGVNHLTTYSYDALDNLKTVIQGSQTRSFVYDSLNRVTSSTNPESGVVTYGYDNQGNLIQKIDARGFVTNVTYDALNRPNSKTYQNDGGVTPPVAYFYDSQALPGGAPSFNRGYSTGRAVAITYGGGSAGDYFGYDAMGRPNLKIQQTGSINFQTSTIYNVAGAMTSMNYPSGRTITNTFDGAGRLSSFAGNLGGPQRTYASGISYSPFGGMKWEQYGTDTPLYQKTFYNIRGQMFDKRVSSVNDTWDWNRGRLINYYSSNHQWGGSGTDNNGNVRFSEHWIPPTNATLDQAQYLIEDTYTYDSLNRISAVSEQTLDIGAGGSWTPRFAQAYTYDRYGNRTINAGSTWGVAIKQFTVNTATNRLGVPSGQSGAMSYDNAGNLTNDTYSGEGARTYDADNRMKQAWSNNQWQTYSYDGDGRRVKRIVNGIETWQVYGLAGELIAEYPANGAPANPQKEYGYRNGELLVTTETTSGGGGGSAQPVTWTNAVGVSVSGNNLTKTAAEGWGNAGASSTQSIASGDGYVETTISETNKYRMIGLSNGDSHQNYNDIDFAFYPAIGGTLYIYEGGTSRGTFGTYATSDVLRVAIEGGVVKYRKNGTLLYTSTVSPTYPLLVDTSFYSNGATLNNVVISSGGGGSSTQNASWTNSVGVAVNGNNLTKTAAEAWGNAGASSTQSIASGDGYVETTISETNKYRMIGLSNGDSHQNYNDIDFALYPAIGGTLYIYEGGTPRGTFGTYATGDVLRVAVEGGVVKYRRNGALLYTSTVTPTYPLLVDTSFYSNGATLNNVVISGAAGGGGGGSSTQIRWLVSDHLGTPRMVFDQTGDLTVLDQNGNYVRGVTRHDYLPFGEELYTGAGGRTTAQGYAGDNVRQKFTSYERDNETGLDYANARYYAHAQGRFTGVDPVGGVASAPQSWNRYTYSLNNPVNFTDPTGMFANAEYGSDPNRESDPFLDYSKKWFRLSNEIQQALEAYQQMVDTGLANLQQKAKKKQEQQQATSSSNLPIPTTATVTVGDPGVVRNREVLNQNGLIYITGIEADYAITFYDQDGNVMGPDSGITVQETVTQIGGEAQSALTNPNAVQPDSNGTFHDGFGPIWTSYAPLRTGEANGIITGMLSTPNSITIEQRLDISVRGIPIATAVSQRTFSNVENGALRSFNAPGGGITNNYRFTTTPITVTRTLRGHMVF